jgi:hypothetical protein
MNDSKKNRSHFPVILYRIIEDESDDIIKWQGEGTSFRIVDHDRFESEVIYKYFKHKKISSLQRQLNLYGFKCINRNDGKGNFYHKNFMRDNLERVISIRRSNHRKRKKNIIIIIIIIMMMMMMTIMKMRKKLMKLQIINLEIKDQDLYLNHYKVHSQLQSLVIMNHYQLVI